MNRGEKWHEQALEHPVRDGVLIVVELVFVWLLFVMIGYFSAAMAYAEEIQREPLPVMEAEDVPVPKPDQHVPDILKRQIDMEAQREWELEGGIPEEDGGEPWDEAAFVPDGVGDGYSDGDYIENFRGWGEGDDGTHHYTWYSQNVLPGGGLTELNENGRHVGDDGFVRDGDGFISVAMDGVDIGTEIETPWGPAKVYDRVGDGEYTGHVDVYTDF